MSEKRCPECGKLFHCEGEGDCWCERVPVHRVQMLKILERYSDCICPECLQKYAASE